MNQIKGTIEYTLTLGGGGVWNLSYNQTIDNDIASIAISEHVLGILNDKLKLDKKHAKGKEIAFLSQRIEKIIQAKFGLSLMFDYCIKLYEIYAGDMKVKADLAAQKAAEGLGENKVIQMFKDGAVEGAVVVEGATEENLTNLSENKD